MTNFESSAREAETNWVTPQGLRHWWEPFLWSQPTSLISALVGAILEIAPEPVSSSGCTPLSALLIPELWAGLTDSQAINLSNSEVVPRGQPHSPVHKSRNLSLVTIREYRRPCRGHPLSSWLWWPSGIVFVSSQGNLPQKDTSLRSIA